MGQYQYRVELLEDRYNEDLEFVELPLALLATSEQKNLDGGAYQLEFTEKISGMAEFSFRIPVYVFDKTTGEEVINPRYRHLKPERKVRVQKDGKFEDFIIKGEQEGRSRNGYVYKHITCTNSKIEDLSHKGWELNFDEENGTGSIFELGPKVLVGSDWVFDAENTDILYEHDYYNVDGDYIEDGGEEGQNNQRIKRTYEPEKGEVQHFTSSRKNLGLPVGSPDPVEVKKWEISEFIETEVGRNLLSNGNSFFTTEHWISEGNLTTSHTKDGDYIRHLQVRGSSPICNVSLDTKNFRFTSNEDYTFVLTHKGPATTYTVEISDEWNTSRNVVVHKSFSVPYCANWKTFGFSFTPKHRGQFNRVFISSSNSGTVKIGKVRVEIGARNGIYNSDFSKGKNGWKLSNIGNQAYEKMLKNYEYRDVVLKTNKQIETTTTTPHMLAIDGKDTASLSMDIKGDDVGSVECIVEARKGSNTQRYTGQLKHDVSFGNRKTVRFKLGSLTGYDDVKLIIKPSGMVYIANLKWESGDNTIWTPAFEDEMAMYPFSPIAEFVSRDKFAYMDSGEHEIMLSTAQENNLQPILEVPQKVRTLLEEKSNCFNLTQALAELFEAFPVYTIERNVDGSIKRNPKTGEQIKKVAFKEHIGKELPYGIEYGINLTEITRDIKTDTLVTKMFVEHNEFEYAPGGIVSISQARDNPSGEEYLLDFSYFIETGLLAPQAKYDVAKFETDLKTINRELGAEQNLSTKLRLEMVNAIIPQLEVAELRVVALEESIRTMGDKIKNVLANTDTETLREQQIYYKQLLADAQLSKTELSIKKTKYEKQLSDLETTIEKRLAEKRKVEQVFVAKYAPYIYEGHWVDDNYVYPDLFFRDAKRVSRRSAFPIVEYNIGVTSLRTIEGFEHLVFGAGDKTFVKDSNLFLQHEDDEYKAKDIEVLVSEINYILDSPENTKIVVRNFETRFEELFERIVASVESLRMNEKVYDRSHNFTTEQEINVDILQKSLENNALILARSSDGTFKVENGTITLGERENPNRMVKLTAGGIFITKDGLNWKTGITPDGINVDELMAGLINTKNIQIWNDQEPRFLWDSKGLIAYGLDANDRTDFDSQIRFNHEGFIFSRNINEDKAELSLTWDGLDINLQDGAVKIGSGAGIVIEDNQKTPVRRVEIGKIDRIAGESDTFSQDNPVPEPVFGIMLRNMDNRETLITSDTGDLWLRNSLSVGDMGTQHMAGISGIVTYTDRQIIEYIKRQYYYDLQEALENLDDELVAELEEKINSEIPYEEKELYRKELEGDPVRFWAGANTPMKAPFKVLQSGNAFMTKAVVEGDITATSGHFSGRVYVGEKQENDIHNTGAGISGWHRDSVRIWAGSPFEGGTTKQSEPEKGLFKVYNTGHVYSTNMDVHGLFTVGETKNGKYSPTLFLAGTDYLFDGELTKHIVEPDLKARLWAGGETPNNANLVITSDGAVYASDIHLSGAIEGEGLKVADVRIDKDGIYTKDYASGVIGNGWYIANDGTADFNNVRVRGEISSATFTHNKVQAAGGTILIRPSTATSKPITIDSESHELPVKDGSLFAIGDNISIKENTNFKLRVTEVSENVLTVRVLSGQGEIAEGTPVINFGTEGSEGILISAKGNSTNTTDGSIIDMHQTTETESDFHEKLRLRVGDLSNIPDNELPNEGYGLYADNVSLKGNLFMTRAGMYNGDLLAPGESRVIRLWVGTPFSHRHEANFKVYEDGTVMARNGIFEGKIIADEGGFSGSVGLGGITINDNTGSFYIEKRDGNTDNFYTIAAFSSDGVTIYDGGIQVFKSPSMYEKTYQYLYPYMFAVNDDYKNDERIVIRTQHFWDFDKEEDVPIGELPQPLTNYSVTVKKAGFEFGIGETANQDKTEVIYAVEDFRDEAQTGFMEYQNDETHLKTEKTSSYVAVEQLDPRKSLLAEFKVDDYKAVTASGGARQYELSIDVEMEEDDTEEAYLVIEYIPTASGETPEMLRYGLPVLAQTKTTFFKSLRIYNYGPNDKFSMKMYLENASKDGGRIYIHNIYFKEITNPVLSAEELAFNLQRTARIGLGLNQDLQIVKTHDSPKINIFSQETINREKSIEGTTNAEIGINQLAEDGVALAVTGNQENIGNISSTNIISAKTLYAEDGGTFKTNDGMIWLNGDKQFPQIHLTHTGSTGVMVNSGRLLFTAPNMYAPIVLTLIHTFDSKQEVALTVGEGQAKHFGVGGDIYNRVGTNGRGNRVVTVASGTGNPSTEAFVGGPKKGDVYVKY